MMMDAQGQGLGGGGPLDGGPLAIFQELGLPQPENISDETIAALFEFAQVIVTRNPFMTHPLITYPLMTNHPIKRLPRCLNLLR